MELVNNGAKILDDEDHVIQKQTWHPGLVTQLDGVSSHTPKCWRFDPGIPSWGPWEATDRCFSLTSMFVFLSLPSYFFLKINKKNSHQTYPRERTG